MNVRYRMYKYNCIAMQIKAPFMQRVDTALMFLKSLLLHAIIFSLK